MSVDFLFDRFPSVSSSFSRSALPWAAAVTPMAPLSKAAHTQGDSKLVDRCPTCYSYINPHCQLLSNFTQWRCSVCRTVCSFPSLGRYAALDDGTQKNFPELNRTLLEYEQPIDADQQHWPIYFFLIDETGDPDYLLLVESAIQGAIEGLQQQGPSKIGIAAFGRAFGLFGLANASCAHVEYSDMEDLSSLNRLFRHAAALTGVENKDAISLAIEAISTVARHAHRPHKERPRAYGTAMRLCFEYFEGHDNVRILSFLSGAPNCGPGELEQGRFQREKSERPDEANERLMEPGDDFYEKLAATNANIVVDQFIVSELEYCDLASLEPLSQRSGGQLLLYGHLSECALPQDLYRQLRSRHAFGVQMKVRTSPEYALTRLSGHCQSQVQDDANLFTAAHCDEHRVFMAEFEFRSSSGFLSFYSAQPVLQLIVAFTGAHQDEAGQWRLTRRLRVHTKKMELAKNVYDLFQHLHVDRVMAALTHQALFTAQSQSLAASREALAQWLVDVLAAYYIEAPVLEADGARRANPLKGITRIAADQDLAFVTCDIPGDLQFLTRGLFGLLKSALLSHSTHPDVRVALRHLARQLSPQSLIKLIYPTLTRFNHTQEPPNEILFLNEPAVSEAHQSATLLMDSLSHLIVLMPSNAGPHADANHPEFRAYLKQLKAFSPYCSPRVVVLSDLSDPDSRLFRSRLIEEESTGDGGIGLKQFKIDIEDKVRNKIREILK